jgi:NAD(P)-dependent dehydrogenase (short-subunit alcohol dehydrogenase family)
MNDVKQRTVAIVGASSGIGLATAQAAAQLGAKAILLGRSQTRLDDAAKIVAASAGEAGTDAVQAIAMDMLDSAAVDRAIASIGAIDHLVLTAAGDELAWRGRIADLTNEQVEASLDKLRGYVNVTRAAAPLMRRGSSITLLSGTSAVSPPEGFSVLAAINASIVSFGKALALELAPIRVNVVMPDVVDTPRHADNRDMITQRAESSPARYLGQPEDIAHAILFLMTNPYMTGHTLVIDGGSVAG